MNRFISSLANEAKLSQINWLFKKINMRHFSIPIENLNVKSNESSSKELDLGDVFGKGSKFSDLDSGKKIRSFKTVSYKRFGEKNEKSIEKDNYFQKKIQNEVEDEDESDKFGTITNEYKDISFQSNISYTKPLSKIIDENDLDLDEEEKKFDKVLNHIRLSQDSYKPHTEKYYAKQIIEFGNEGKIKEAVSVFLDDMIERDRYKPSIWLYKLLMKILARAGYTHMVFALFKKLTDSKDDDWNTKMTSRYLEKMMTVLFLACSNCKWPEYAIRKTDSIRVYLKNRNITPNYFMYASMINAYGKSGAIYEAFNCVDEMLMNNLELKNDIIDNLLCACISDKKHGFKYALSVWQMCLKLKLTPNLRTFNLLLRAAKDCNVASTSSSKNYLPKKISDSSVEINKISLLNNEFKKNYFNTDSLSPNYQDEFSDSNFKEDFPEARNFETNQSVIESIKEKINTCQVKIEPEKVEIVDDFKLFEDSLNKQIKSLEWWQDIKSNVNKIELLKEFSDSRPELKKLKELIITKTSDSLLTKPNKDLENSVFPFLSSEKDTPSGHLAILGGINGVFKSMNFHKVEPDLKSIQLILELTENNLDSENELLEKMKENNIKIDINFINILMKRRIFRKDFDSFEEAFKMIQENQLVPNISTFGCIAFKITKLEDLKIFLSDLKKMNFELNQIIISNLMNKGVRHRNFDYLVYLCTYIYKNQIKLNDHIIEKLENHLDLMKKKIIAYEKKISQEESEIKNYESLKEFYNNFKFFYFDWKNYVSIEQKSHPYEKFSRKDDRLYQSFVIRTEKLRQN